MQNLIYNSRKEAKFGFLSKKNTFRVTIQKICSIGLFRVFLQWVLRDGLSTSVKKFQSFLLLLLRYLRFVLFAWFFLHYCCWQRGHEFYRHNLWVSIEPVLTSRHPTYSARQPLIGNSKVPFGLIMFLIRKQWKMRMQCSNSYSIVHKLFSEALPKI